jgi:hypothetical protein
MYRDLDVTIVLYTGKFVSFFDRCKGTRASWSKFARPFARLGRFLVSGSETYDFRARILRQIQRFSA